MEIKLKEILKSLEDITIDNIVIVESKKDMPQLNLQEFDDCEFIDNRLMYKSDNVLIVREHYHKHHYFKGEYKEDFNYVKYIVYIAVNYTFKISHVLDNYNKDF